MKIGVRKSPHLEFLLDGMLHGQQDVFTSTNDTGADFYLCWGWPQAEQVERDNGGRRDRIICMDAHPFALKAGDVSGDRILQLGNWGAVAKYPPVEPISVPCLDAPINKGGPVLVLGQVDSTEQQRLGLVDAWHTPGYGKWVLEEMSKPNRKFRPHPRMWNESVPQPSLASDLHGCSSAVSWNSTAAVHSQLLGYPCSSAEEHGWGRMILGELAALRVTPKQLRTGEYWAEVYRPWLLSLI